jgi:hypothetical protein
MTISQFRIEIQRYSTPPSTETLIEYYLIVNESQCLDVNILGSPRKILNVEYQKVKS